MRIMVDQLPKIPSECIFAKYGMSGMAECKLEVEGVKCHLEFGLKCNKLTNEIEILEKQRDLLVVQTMELKKQMQFDEAWSKMVNKNRLNNQED